MLTKKIFRFGFMALLVMFALTSAACKGKKANGDPLGAIKSRGALKVGVKADVPGFGLRNTETRKYEGFEIELAKLFADDIFGDASKVEFTTVTARTRGPLVDTGELDMIIATFTITEERKLTFNFTRPYYTDAVGMLVLKSSGIESLKDCNGKTIGVAQSATSREVIDKAAKEMGITLKFAEFSTYPELKAALDSKRIDVFSVDKSILGGYLDAASVILPDQFDPQPYGVVTKLSNSALYQYTEEKIAEWLSDGTITRLVEQFKL